MIFLWCILLIFICFGSPKPHLRRFRLAAFFSFCCRRAFSKRKRFIYVICLSFFVNMLTQFCNICQYLFISGNVHLEEKLFLCFALGVGGGTRTWTCDCREEHGLWQMSEDTIGIHNCWCLAKDDDHVLVCLFFWLAILACITCLLACLLTYLLACLLACLLALW